MPLPIIAGAAAGLGSSILGNALAGKDRDAAMKLIEQSIKDYEEIGIPPIEAQQLLLEELKSAGQLTPELEQMVTLGPSKMGEISLDPSYKAAQLKALDELTAIGEQGGMRLSDEAALEDVLSKVRASERGSREAILANQRERGVSGGGSELAAQLANQQNSASNAYAQGLNVAGMAQDRALNAIISGGDLAGKIRGQEFGEKSDIARAEDEIARFNAANQIDLGTRNVGYKNAAQERNLNEKQRIMDSNVGLRNTGQQYNKELLQKQFDNKLALAGGKAGARAGQVDNLNRGADRTNAMWTGIGQGLATIGSSIYDKQAAGSQRKADRQWISDEREKDRVMWGGK